MAVRKNSNFQNMNMLYIILKQVIWRFDQYKLFSEIFKFRENTNKNRFREISWSVHKILKFKHFAKVVTYRKSPDYALQSHNLGHLAKWQRKGCFIPLHPSSILQLCCQELSDWFPLSQLRPRQRPVLSQNKAISMKNDCSWQPYNCFVFVLWSWHLPNIHVNLRHWFGG